MTDIATWLGQQLDEDAMWAREASRDRNGDVPTGSHWQWVNNHDDRVLTPDPATEEWLDEDSEAGQPSLRSVEEFDTTSSYTLPQFPIHNAEEIRSAVAGHIARHDPARVLREVAAKRALLDLHRWQCCARDVTGYTVIEWYDSRTDPCPTLRVMAAPYADRDGYNPAWRVE